MVVEATPPPDLSALDSAGLKELVLSLHAQLQARNSEIENLRPLILKLRRMQFGRKSEKLDKQIEQLELQLEDLETAQAEATPPVQESAPVEPEEAPAKKRERRSLPEHLAREKQRHEPKQTECPACGGALRLLGEDISEILEYVPASFNGIQIIRPKLSCACCEHIVQEPAPSCPVERGAAGPGLLAHVLVSKYASHPPLYRQSEIFLRAGVDLSRSTPADWVGGVSQTLAPLVEAMRKYVLASGKLHGDDTPVPVLAPGNGKTNTGRLWT